MSYLDFDPALFPKLAEYLSYSWDHEALSRFDLNVVRGCTAFGAVKQSYEINSKQVNLIVPGRVTATNPCGNELGFATTYGNGYTSHTSLLTSPYPGIGTVRAMTDNDKIRKLDGTIYTDPTHGHFYMNMVNSGDDEKTAEWAARLKAHWALENVGGLFPSHIHGVFTDNHLWWNAFNSNNSKGLQGSGVSWDDGLVRNAYKLRALLPGTILGGNGANWVCGGIHGNTYAGTIPDGNCLSIDAGMYEIGDNKIDWPEAWDHFIPIMIGWIDKKKIDNRQRYGIFTVYGSRVAIRNGRPLADKDKRIALAIATIGGWHLWMTQDESWATTIVPGLENSIPEMGWNTSFPHGWLGNPIEAPVRVGLGLWYRKFEGGTVYANSTSTTATMAGKLVPPKDAVFEKGVSVLDPTIKDMITNSIAEHRLNKFYYTRWQRDNPIESVKVISYLDGGNRPLDSEVLTHYGKGLLLAEDASRRL